MPKNKSPIIDKPSKPYADFPLTPHPNGQWCKKIRGKVYFFGRWNDHHAALAKYEMQRDDLYAGRKPRARADGLELRDLCNHFLTAKHRKMEAGEIQPRTMSEYRDVAVEIAAVFGRHRLVDDLTPEDFGQLREHLSKSAGPVRLANLIQRVRSVFKFGYDAGLIDKPMRFGPEFIKPSRKVIRKARSAAGEKMYEPAEIKALCEAASTQMRAMILLAINGGFGNTDCAQLPLASIDLKRKMIDFPRPKTSIPRRCPLWPETAKALTAAIQDRPEPADEAHEGLAFLTYFGRPWVRTQRKVGDDNHAVVVVDSIGLEFGKLCRLTGVHRKGRGFYSLRHTFRTIADSAGDRPAVDFIMGHEDGGDMRTHYVERLDDDRLRKVADHVHLWLYGTTARKPKSRAVRSR